MDINGVQGARGSHGDTGLQGVSGAQGLQGFPSEMSDDDTLDCFYQMIRKHEQMFSEVRIRKYYSYEIEYTYQHGGTHSTVITEDELKEYIDNSPCYGPT